MTTYPTILLASQRRSGTHQEHGHRLADDVARADAYATCPAERDLRRLDQLDHGKSATRHEAAPAVDDLADAGGRTSHASIVPGVFVTLYVPAVETVPGRLFVAEVAGAGP